MRAHSEIVTISFMHSFGRIIYILILSRKKVKILATLGGWDISSLKSCNLPQKAASAFANVCGGLVGAEYMPVLYVGSQQVNGTNHCIIAVQSIITANPEKRLVKMVINEALDNSASIVSISGI